MGQMWKAIAPNVALADLRVIDLGCGAGDLAYRCHVAGAAHVLGVDRDLHNLIGQKKKWKGQIRGLVFAEMNIDALSTTRPMPFSVRAGIASRWGAIQTLTIPAPPHSAHRAPVFHHGAAYHFRVIPARGSQHVAHVLVVA